MNEKLKEVRELLGDDFGLLVDAFNGDNRACLNNAKKLASEKQALEMANEIHSVKGAASNVGAEELAALCQELESKGRSGDLDSAPILLASISEKFEELIVELERAR